MGAPAVHKKGGVVWPGAHFAEEAYLSQVFTVAILAQGTSWAVADTQAFLHSGSNPPAPQSILNQNFTSIPKSKTNENVPIPNLGLE